MENIEVEIRSFIPEGLYYKLLQFFKENSELVEEDTQETHYFDCEQDLRIQKRNSNAKIWMKKGQVHDEFREEIEIVVNKEYFDKAQKIFNQIGLNTQIIWLRNRKQFNWNNIKVCLDYTKGYGHIIEFEILTSEDKKELALEELKQKFKELNIPLTPRDEFEKKYKEYLGNWEKLT